MCKHFLNAQVSVRTQCCRKWYDCPECHEENEDHKLRKTLEMTFICKKCKKAFRKDLTDFDETDSFCPHCDNEFVIPAVTKETKQEVPPAPTEQVLSKIQHLDPRMIRDGDVDDEELGFERDYSARLG
uniref:ARAD1A04070p n=1 Tax=Blastobotrys adeninivorans TaxID=409370 RepID=A0A060SWF1_BLAAD